MRRTTIFGALLILAGFLALRTSSEPPQVEAERSVHGKEVPAAIGTEDDPNARDEMEFLMLRDPITNAIPMNIREREVAFARGIPDQSALNRATPGGGGPSVQALVWTERGPNNVGGRTRAFAVDASSPTTLLAGSVAGGVWKSTNEGASWSLRTAPAQIHGTTCIAQDQRIGKTQVWYVGSGEFRGSTNNDTRWGSFYRGDGVFKSTDNGDTWALLSSTSSGTPETTEAFDFVFNVATNPAAPPSRDDVLAATYFGIYRSTDGGSTWSNPLASDLGFTDIAVTSTGVAYAFTKSSTAPRLWRSTDGVVWTNIVPAGFPTFTGRIVIGLAASNPNVVYFFVQGANFGAGVQGGHQLWKYTYVSGDGFGVGGVWENRGGNLPSDTNTQTGYDMTVQVKPDDENFVLIGGTNFYRSTNGFATAVATTVIGGYTYFASYLHPDLHGGAFNPVQPATYYSAGDGGISKSADITTAQPEWVSLNNGYNVTQFYSVSIAPESGSDVIMAGAQDNGTQLGTAPGASDWIMAFGGDGTVVKVAPIADDRLYTQYQNGNMQRQTRDGLNVETITPSGATNQLFVNPIVLDPNNSALLYYPAGTSPSSSMIWRNDSAPIATIWTGWSVLGGTDVGSGSNYVRRITALGISTANAPNVLYYGTVDGMVMRAVNAHAAPTTTNVTPPGLNGGTSTGGFVRCIAVDPTNSNKALVAFGNYNFRSLWYTTDGGATWTDVEGNLTGSDGPSVRWATMFYVGGVLRVYLGTSIGVLSTTSLVGSSTIWTQQASAAIGNVLIAYMDYRPSDRTLAVATHGRGVFTTQFPLNVAVGDDSDPRGRVALSQSYPNPARRSATITYELPYADRVSLRVYDVTGREVATLVEGRQERGRHEARFTAGRLPRGVYYYVLKTGSGSETKTLLLR